MDFLPSPHQDTKYMCVIKQELRGDRLEVTDIFKWDRVVLNLPCSIEYNPARHWIYKVKNDKKKLAIDMFWYIDEWTLGVPTVWECWKVTQKFCCKFTPFGIKDTGRKRKGASKPPREWLGTVLKIVNGETCLLISQKIW